MLTIIVVKKQITPSITILSVLTVYVLPGIMTAIFPFSYISFLPIFSATLAPHLAKALFFAVILAMAWHSFPKIEVNPTQNKKEMDTQKRIQLTEINRSEFLNGMTFFILFSMLLSAAISIAKIGGHYFAIGEIAVNVIAIVAMVVLLCVTLCCHQAVRKTHIYLALLLLIWYVFSLFLKTPHTVNPNYYTILPVIASVITLIFVVVMCMRYRNIKL